ncbi:hypothetical protein DFQ26_002237 [Actinomortierella ambigua]|nr:hypothetical protein DFQ26_002237 [Actinomortierella ambigua]
MTDAEELAEKYQKLFQDYTRIKAQHAVLKKAVLKSLQQLDLLSFHNQRLTKRIENLQELGSPKSSGSWMLGGGSVKKELEKAQEALEVATLDLQNKIEENEKLHQQLYEINALYPRHVTELQSKIQELEKLNQELQLDVERAGVANEDTINLIRKEKTDIESELGMIQDALAGQLQDERRTNEGLRNKLQKLEDDLQRLSDVERQFEDLQAEHSNLKGELETFKFISAEYTQLQESHHHLEQQKGQLEKMHGQLLENFSALKRTEESLRSALGKEEAKARSFQEQAEGLVRSLDILKSTSATKEQEQESQISGLTTELGRMKQEQAKFQKEYEQLKEAGEAAKQDESRSKAALAEDLQKTRTKLMEAESRVQELEMLKQQLEADLEKTKTELTEASAVAAAATASTAVPVAKGDMPSSNEDGVKNEGVDEVADESHQEDGHGTDEEGPKEQKPLSKKQRKKKRAAEAAAAAAAAAAAETGTATTASTATASTATVSPSGGDRAAEAAAPSKEALGDEALKDTAEESRQVKERLEKEIAEKEKLRDEQEKLLAEQKKLEALVETLQFEVSKAQGLSADKLVELGKVQASLEALQDEKDTLTNSLATHVDITLQLQHELDDLKKQQKQDADQKVAPKVNGYPSEAKPNHSEDDDEEPLERRKKHSPTTSSLPPTPKETEDREEEGHASQANERQEALVKPSETPAEPMLIDLDPPQDSDINKFADITAGALEGKIVSGGSTPAVTADQSIQPSSTAQAQREYLIKKHYEAKLQSLVEQLQLSDSRYVRLNREFGLLEELLKETARQQAEQAVASKALEAQNKELRAELEEAKEENRRQVETMTQFMQSLEQQ